MYKNQLKKLNQNKFFTEEELEILNSVLQNHRRELEIDPAYDIDDIWIDEKKIHEK